MFAQCHASRQPDAVRCAAANAKNRWHLNPYLLYMAVSWSPQTESINTTSYQLGFISAVWGGALVWNGIVGTILTRYLLIYSSYVVQTLFLFSVSHLSASLHIRPWFYLLRMLLCVVYLGFLNWHPQANGCCWHFWVRWGRGEGRGRERRDKKQIQN